MILICKLLHSGELCERENWHVVELDDGTVCCTLCTGLLETSMLFAHSSGTKAPVACDPASGALCVTTLVVKGHSHSATGWRANILHLPPLDPSIALKGSAPHQLASDPEWCATSIDASHDVLRPRLAAVATQLQRP
jgi:hypothetical protein